MKRRSFVKHTGAVLGGISLVGAAGCAPDASEFQQPRPRNRKADEQLARIGVQLYTVRALLENDFEGTLRAVAEAGYDELEFAGYYDRDPAEIRALVDELGMTAPSIHVPFERLQGGLDPILSAAKTLGHQYIICPYLGEQHRSLAGYRAAAAAFNRIGGACKDQGFQFGYHNHDFEFESFDGTVGYDVLLRETDPELVVQELDLFWVIKGGRDPLDYFDRYPGRFHCCHVKDMGTLTGTQEMVAVGEGEIDFGAIFAEAKKAGLRHYFVEHDNPDDPLASIQTSYNNLSALRF